MGNMALASKVGFLTLISILVFLSGIVEANWSKRSALRDSRGLPPWMTSEGIDSVFFEKELPPQEASGFSSLFSKLVERGVEFVTGLEEKVTKSSRLREWSLNLDIEPPEGSPWGAGGPDDIGHYAGYYKLNRTHDASLFYFFFESREAKDSDPVVLWMTGGPGCSSELAVFYENGPFTITKDLKLQWNDYGWDKVANMIYIDQPVNVGFSYSHDKRDAVHDEKGVSNDVYMFLQEFFAAHPKYATRDFFVTGESYGGHYVPAVAHRVNEGNKAKEGAIIPLKGFAIGNGLTQPDIQYAAYPDFALQNGLIGELGYKTAKAQLPVCEAAIHACGTKGVVSCYAAFFACNVIVNTILGEAGNVNVYDVRKNCTYYPLCYDFSLLDEYLAKEDVRKALGVGDRPFVECNMHVYFGMLRDWMRNLEVSIPGMLEEGIRALIYAGEDDFVCNWLGNSRWVESMAWSGHDAYAAAPWLAFAVDGEEKGLTIGHGPLNFLKVYESGHMVPMDQPKAALEMLRRWIHNEPLAVGSEGGSSASAM